MWVFWTNITQKGREKIPCFFKSKFFTNFSFDNTEEIFYVSFLDPHNTERGVEEAIFHYKLGGLLVHRIQRKG